MEFGLGIMCGLLLLWALTETLRRYDAEGAMYELAKEQLADHAKCMALVSAFVGNATAARAVHEAANRLESTEGQQELAILARDYDGDDNIISVWLRQHADKVLEGNRVSAPD